MKKSIITLSASALLFFIFSVPSYSKGVYILCYHAFLEKKDPYSFTNDQFREQLRKLKSNGFTFVKYEDVINDKITGNKNILISIDDGNKSVYQAYYSIMKPMGIKPLLGIYPAIIGKVKYAMTWDEVKQLSEDGCAIASHGYHHMFLSEKYYKEDPASFKKEIYLSKKVLEEKLNRPIDTMVYPFGVSSEISTSELKKAGYKYGLSIEPRMESLPIRSSFEIHRYLMTKGGQKGVIASISKNAERKEADSSNGSFDTSQNGDGYSSETGYRFTLADYPDTVKKFITDDIILLSSKTETDPKKNIKFKPFKHPAKSAAAKKNKKVTSKSEKKNQRKKKSA